MITLGPKYLTLLGAQHLWALVALAYALIGVHDEWAAIRLLSLATAYMLGLRIEDHRPFWAIYSAVVACFIIAACFERAINPSMVAYGAALGLAGAMAFNQPIYIVTNSLGLAALPSRGALATAGALWVAWLWRRSRLASLAIVGVIAVLFFLKDGMAISTYQRLGIWQDTLNQLSILGSGFGSFQDAYASWPVHRNIWDVAIWLAPHAYNDVLELLFELGIGSVFVWFMLITAVGNADRPALLIFLAFAILSLTYFPLSIPLVGHMFFFTLGGVGRGACHIPSLAGLDRPSLAS